VLKKLKNIDWQIRGISFLMAVLLWAFVVTDNTFFLELEIPIQIAGLPKGQTISKSLPKTVVGKFRGQGADLLMVYLTPLLSETGFLIDASKFHKVSAINLNDYFAEHPDGLVLPRDYNLELINIVRPDTIWISLEEESTKLLQLIPSLKVKLKPGYIMVGKVMAVPEYLSVTGPKSILDSLRHITLKSFELNNVIADIAIEVPVSLQPSELILLQQKTVTVKANIQSIGSQRFDAVPIILTNVPKGLNVVTIPETISLIAEGGQDRLLTLNSSDFVGTFDFEKSWKPNQIIYDINILLPADVQHISKLIPEKIEILIRDNEK
jgi:YbbR domain-containing protein